ncbi:MAG: hypothetical protein ACJA1Z_003061 [Patiriisocius sp.]|jgi:hypothetical protein
MKTIIAPIVRCEVSKQKRRVLLYDQITVLKLA